MDGETTILAGIGSALLPLAIVYGRQIAEVIAKAIPDSTNGVWAIVRMVLKFVAGYRKNQE